MRKTMSLLAALSLTGGLASAPSALAQGGCGDVTFTQQVLSQFPSAPEACQDIVTKDGRQFAHFKGEIVGTRQGQVRARFQKPDGQFTDTYTFTPPAGARANIQGRNMRFSELSRGQELNIYLPPDRFEFNVPETESFASAPPTQIVRITAITRAPAALPTTGSSIPLVGVLSLALLGLGTGLTLIRRRLS
jgi:hypothetical protein